MSFESLGLSAAIVGTVAKVGYDAPTAVQMAVIPAVLAGGDVWASAETGSGKTAAFVLPLLERLSQASRRAPRAVRVLVLAPTRELAMQIESAFALYGQGLVERLKTCVLVGGVSENPQMMALRGGADVVVATPGRLLDLVAKNAVSLRDVQTLVLDEADRLLSMGFGDELGSVLELLPRERQTLLLSATFPPAVKALAASLLREPTRVQVEAELREVPLITQRAIEVDVGKRTQLLRHLLQERAWPAVLVFVASRHGADHVTDKLTRAGIAAAALHADLSQSARTRALQDLKNGRLQVLVATDVAARGIDIRQLSAVVNYDLPRSPTDYLHRIGRTGRAGAAGEAVSFIIADADAHFALIERRHHLQIQREQIAGFERTELPKPTLDPHGGIKGRRKSKKDKLREAAALAAATKPRA
ncbi:MAG TPA: DEAD/DEAH box helicase [Polyangiaceae bacterium]|nr:DEAD/DEAH box helicase [Polyangiaceae bacterium]